MSSVTLCGPACVAQAHKSQPDCHQTRHTTIFTSAQVYILRSVQSPSFCNKNTLAFVYTH